jgi:hypothetical protein
VSVGPGVLIVSYNTLELTRLAVASVRCCAPGSQVFVMDNGSTDGTQTWLQRHVPWASTPGDVPVGAAAHAYAIERFRERGLGWDAVTLLDSDAMLLSARWWDVTWDALRGGHDLIGGYRTRGIPDQLFALGSPRLHASCLTMTRDLFERVPSFAAEPPDPDLGVIVRDTAWQASTLAKNPLVIPFAPRGAGPVFDGLPLHVHVDPDDPAVPLWSHLWRGTSWAPASRWREMARRVAAALGSPRAQKVLRRRALAAAFVERGTAWLERKA